MSPWTAQEQVLFHPLCASILHHYCDGLCPSAVQRTRQGRRLNLRGSWLNVSPGLLQVNLMQYMKLSTSRDFRINASVLDSALQERNSEDAENEPHNDQVRIHAAAFTERFPPLYKPAVFVSCAEQIVSPRLALTLILS